MQKLKISFQFVNGDKHVLELQPSTTIAEIKEEIYKIMKEESKIEPKDQKFIFSGRILKDTDKLEDVEELKDKSNILVMGKSKKQEKKEERTSSVKKQPTQMPKPNFDDQNANFMPHDMDTNNLGQSKNNFPFIDYMLNVTIEYFQEDPTMIDMDYEQMMQDMSESDKAAFRQQIINELKELQNNPQFLSTFMRSTTEITNFDKQQPQFNMHQQFNQQVPSIFGYIPLDYKPPIDPYPPQQFSPNFSSADINFEEVFAEQLVSLNEMGFSNKKLNFEALKKSNGNVNKAVELLIKWCEENN